MLKTSRSHTWPHLSPAHHCGCCNLLHTALSPQAVWFSNQCHINVQRGSHPFMLSDGKQILRRIYRAAARQADIPHAPPVMKERRATTHSREWLSAMTRISSRVVVKIQVFIQTACKWANQFELDVFPGLLIKRCSTLWRKTWLFFF